MLVYRLAFCTSMLLEASHNMSGSGLNIVRCAAWTLYMTTQVDIIFYFLPFKVVVAAYGNSGHVILRPELSSAARHYLHI